MTDVSIVAMLLPIWMAHRKHLKSNQDFHVFEDIPKDLYELRKQQMKNVKKPEREDAKHTLAKPIRTNFLWTENMLRQISHCSKSDGICISFCKLLNFIYMFLLFSTGIFGTINKELEM